MKRFTKIKAATDGQGMELNWSTHDDDETHTHALVCKEAPHGDFVMALDALLPDVLEIMELPVGYLDGMRVLGVSFTLNEVTGARGGVVSAVKAVKIANGPVNLATPKLIGDPAPDDAATNDDDRRGHMPTGMWSRVLDVEREGWAYLDGKRAPKAQVDMFEGADKDGDDEHDDDETTPAPAAPTRRRRPRDPLASV